MHSLAELTQVIAQMRQLGMSQQITTYSVGYNPKILEQLGPAAEGLDRHLAGADLHQQSKRGASAGPMEAGWSGAERAAVPAILLGHRVFIGRFKPRWTKSAFP
jgi:hypothetical protein